MHNWFAIETETEYRRHEWERAAAADARIAQIRGESTHLLQMHLPHLSLAGLRRLVAPRLAFGLPLASRRRAASC
jgi:hypothetical protein